MDYTIPTHYVCATINDDWSGLTDLDSLPPGYFTIRVRELFL
jgi:hypothetical protein